MSKRKGAKRAAASASTAAGGTSDVAQLKDPSHEAKETIQDEVNALQVYEAKAAPGRSQQITGKAAPCHPSSGGLLPALNPNKAPLASLSPRHHRASNAISPSRPSNRHELTHAHAHGPGPSYGHGQVGHQQLQQQMHYPPHHNPFSLATPTQGQNRHPHPCLQVSANSPQVRNPLNEPFGDSLILGGAISSATDSTSIDTSPPAVDMKQMAHPQTGFSLHTNSRLVNAPPNPTRPAQLPLRPLSLPHSKPSHNVTQHHRQQISAGNMGPVHGLAPTSLSRGPPPPISMAGQPRSGFQPSYASGRGPPRAQASRYHSPRSISDGRVDAASTVQNTHFVHPQISGGGAGAGGPFSTNYALPPRHFGAPIGQPQQHSLRPNGNQVPFSCAPARASAMTPELSVNPAQSHTWGGQPLPSRFFPGPVQSMGSFGQRLDALRQPRPNHPRSQITTASTTTLSNGKYSEHLTLSRGSYGHQHLFRIHSASSVSPLVQLRVHRSQSTVGAQSRTRGLDADATTPGMAREGLSGFFAPSRTFAHLTPAAYCKTFQDKDRDRDSSQSGQWFTGPWMRSTMIDHILSRPIRGIGVSPSVQNKIITKGSIQKSLTGPRARTNPQSHIPTPHHTPFGLNGRPDFDGPAVHVPKDERCWISACRSLDWAIWDIARRLALTHVSGKGDKMVRLAVIRSATSSLMASDALGASGGPTAPVGASRDGPSTDTGWGVTTSRSGDWENYHIAHQVNVQPQSRQAIEQVITPYIILQSKHPDIISPTKRALSAEAIAKSKECLEVLYWGRIFGENVLEDHEWSAEHLPFRLPSKFWCSPHHAHPVLPGWLGRLRWDPKTDSWGIALAAMREMIHPTTDWEDQPLLPSSGAFTFTFMQLDVQDFTPALSEGTRLKLTWVSAGGLLTESHRHRQVVETSRGNLQLLLNTKTSTKTKTKAKAKSYATDPYWLAVHKCTKDRHQGNVTHLPQCQK
ncbi:hypothetical protein I317_06911 [Kwoniella heveanensis CBS 569]|nr:hypothetical protein I317_06911 [Kwoniella heveanensis CBS 569]